MTAESIGIPGLRLGDIVPAERFDHSEPLPIKVVSRKVAGGGAAYILKGEIQSPEPRADEPLLVAIKVILAVSLDNVHRERIRRELAAVERAQHPYILPFIGSLTTDGYTILVSAFMENGNMLEYIQKNPAAGKERLVIRIAEMEALLTSFEIFHVADAVKHLHEAQGLVHGDLKCENVLISADGDALLADFGLSTTVGDPAQNEATATAIRKSNTRRFAAPELFIDGAKSPSGRIRSKTTQTDVYAFGMFIIQAFTKARPWPDLDDEFEIRTRISNRKPYPRPANSSGIGFEDRWWKLCQACFRFEPKERPTIGEIHSQLKAILGITQEAPKVEKKVISEEPSGNGEAGTTAITHGGVYIARLASSLRRRSKPFAAAHDEAQPDGAGFAKFDQPTPISGHMATFSPSARPPTRGVQDELPPLYSHVNTASSSDDLNSAFSHSPQGVPQWVIAAQGADPDISRVNPDTLASVFGVLDSDGIREIDDMLKQILVGVHRGLTKLGDRSWGAITQFLSQCPVLQARNAPNSEINGSRSYHIARTNWFKSSASHDDILSVVHAWLKELIEDADVIDERAEVNLNTVAGVVAHAGNTMEGRSMQYRKETGQIKTLDLGMIRYPDRSHPYVKVYRIELFAWFDSRSIAGRSSDNNGIYGQFNSKSYSLNETITDQISSSVVDKAVREAEDLFL